MSFEDPTPRVRRALIARLKASGLSERELARRVGIPRSSLRRILHGPGELHLRHIALLAGVLDVSPGPRIPSSLGATPAEARQIIEEIVGYSVKETVAACRRFFEERSSPGEAPDATFRVE